MFFFAVYGEFALCQCMHHSVYNNHISNFFPNIRFFHGFPISDLDPTEVWRVWYVNSFFTLVPEGELGQKLKNVSKPCK